jgi:hypothetical protein
MADNQRAQVYAAENAAFDGTSIETIVDFAELTALAERVTDSGWWPLGRLVVKQARSDASTSTTVWRPGQPPEVRITRPQQTRGTLVHELAHVLAGRDAGHGPLYRSAHLSVAESALGAEPAMWLEQAYRDFGLTIGPARWPRGSSAIAL